MLPWEGHLGRRAERCLGVAQSIGFSEAMITGKGKARYWRLGPWRFAAAGCREATAAAARGPDRPPSPLALLSVPGGTEPTLGARDTQ